jgi:hypothetical protein
MNYLSRACCFLFFGLWSMVMVMSCGGKQLVISRQNLVRLAADRKEHGISARGLGIPNFGSNVSSQRGLLYRVEKEMGQIDRLLEATSPTPYTNVPFVRIMRLRCIMILLGVSEVF